MFLKNFFERFKSHTPPKYMLMIMVAFGYFFWHSTQHLILLKDVPACGIGDLLQDSMLWFNEYAHAHPKFASYVLIISSLWIDLSVLILCASALFRTGSRPLIAVGLFLFLRQILQLLVSLPIPDKIIWTDPGFPSILVTYQVSNDLYFSSHTGMSMLAAMELSRLNRKIFSFFGYGMLIFEIWTVIAFQIHYTMDVYSAIITVFLVSFLANRISPKIDSSLCRLDSWIRR